jgi:uncharacterized protein YegL
MRRLPVYILIDTPGCMAGEPIEAVKKGIQSLVASLRGCPTALEFIWLSVIAYSNYAMQIVPLVDLSDFQMPQFEASGGSELGDALIFLYNKVNVEFIKTTIDKKGDWKPLVFIISVIDPGNISDSVKVFKNFKWGVVVACAADEYINNENLKLITKSLVRFDPPDPLKFEKIFNWITSALIAVSKIIEISRTDILDFNQFPPLPPEIKLID